MESLKDEFTSEDFQNDLDILLEEGIIFADDDRVKCLHAATDNAKHRELSEILEEMAAKKISNYDVENLSEDDDIEPYYIHDGHWRDSNGEFVRIIHTTEKFEYDEAREFVSNHSGN